MINPLLIIKNLKQRPGLYIDHNFESVSFVDLVVDFFETESAEYLKNEKRH